MSTILIVEDHAESRYLLEKLLSSKGYRVMAAENGQQGLQMARREPPDIIISDIMMPVMNGFKLCCRVKKDPVLRQIPFIFYTATFVDDSDRKLAMSLGASRFLVKPTEGDQFTQIIEDVLKEHQGGTLHIPKGPTEDHESLIEMYENSITRKLAETVEKLQEERRALIQSERRLKEAQELAHIGHWELDLKTGALEWSDEIYRILGMKPHAFDPSYKTLMAMGVIHPEDRAFVARTHQETLSKKAASDIEYRLLLEDGAVKYVNEKFQTLYDDEGMPNCSMGTVQDITERREAEAALKESEEKYRFLVEHAGEVILVAQDGRFKFVNHNVSDLLGYSPEELMEKFFTDYIHPDDRALVSERHEKRTKGEVLPTVYPFRVINKVGGVRWVELTAAAIEWEGRPATLNFLSDITDRKRAEEDRDKLRDQFLQAQKMESVGRLAGGVAHDFNNKLTVILGYVQMAMMDLDRTDPLYEKLDQAMKAVRQSVDIVRQLLAFARKQIISPKVLDLNETIEGMLKMLRHLIGEDIDLAWEPENHLWAVKMDPVQIDQILANLCVNARDAISGAGKITIETDNVVLDENYCADRAGFATGQYVMIGVSDNGCGMDKETLATAFEPFFTTKEVGKGTGLGLATVYGIVKQNNGFVNIYSEPGKGTRVEVYLPRQTEETEEKGEAVETEMVHCHGETILMVEDDTSVLRLAERVLEKMGYRVLTADTPAEAIHTARDHEGTIQLLITDVVLPEMSGKELAEEIMQIRPNIRVLFMSGYTANVIAHQGVLDEGVSFMEKPFTFEGLARKVREALGRRNAELKGK